MNTALKIAALTPAAYRTKYTLPVKACTLNTANNYPPEEPKKFGRFTLLSILGSGGMGVVYEAFDPERGQKVALKVLRRGLPEEAKGIQRFLREAQALGTIQHPRVVTIHDVGIEEELPYLSMELLQGCSLETRIQEGKPWPVNQVLQVATQLAEALDQIHAQGLIHRDLKPANIWLSKPNQEVVLLDFGLARRIEGQMGLTASSLMIGTPQYTSPENARGDRMDARCDLFSLGIILYELCTGRKPFEGTTALALMEQITRYHPPRVSVVNPAVPTLLSNLNMELLAKFAKDRPESARVVGQRLQKIQPKSSSQIVLPVAPEQTMNAPEIPPLVEPEPGLPVSRGLWLWSLVACFLLVLGISFFKNTPTGQLKVESSFPVAEVEIWSENRAVARVLTDRPIDLPEGKYKLKLLFPEDRAKLDSNDLEVVPGKVNAIQVVKK